MAFSSESPAGKGRNCDYNLTCNRLKDCLSSLSFLLIGAVENRKKTPSFHGWLVILQDWEHRWFSHFFGVSKTKRYIPTNGFFGLPVRLKQPAFPPKRGEKRYVIPNPFWVENMLTLSPPDLTWSFYSTSRWWFQIIFFFTPKIGGRFPIWRLIFFRWVGSTAN